MKPINTAQLVLEILVMIGFLIGMLPFGYWLVFWWVIPLTITNTILASISKNNTQGYTITNIFMALLSFIPIIGFFARIIGVIMCTLSIVQITKK